MGTARFYIELPDVKDRVTLADGSVVEPETDLANAKEIVPPFDIKTILLFESKSRSGTYTRIDEFPATLGMEYIETDKAQDLSHWFRIKFRSGNMQESMFSDPLLAEEVLEAIEIVRYEMHDTKDPPAYDDEHYLRQLRSAAYRHAAYENLSMIRAHDWGFLIMLMKADVARQLAGDSAKYSSLSLPGGLQASRQGISDNYVKLAKTWEEAYEKARKDINQVNPIKSDVKVGNIIIDDMYTGRQIRSLRPTKSRTRRIN